METGRQAAAAADSDRTPATGRESEKRPARLVQRKECGRAACGDAFRLGTGCRLLRPYRRSPRRNHGHMDCGAFIYEADGVRWAMDLGAQNYSKLEKVLQIWDMKQDSERWQVFRYGADSHNIARIGGQPQRVDGKGAITAASGNMIEADLTPVYAGGAERVVRRPAWPPTVP